MTEEYIDNSPAPEALTDQDNGATPLRHQPEAKAPEPEMPVQAKSASDAIKDAMAKVEAESGEKVKAEPKVKVEEKPPAEVEDDVGDDEDGQEEVEAKKPDEAGEKENAKATQSEGKAERIPSRLLPKARDVWWNTPGPVRAEFDRMEREFSDISEKHKASAEFHESLRQYDDMAKSANTTVKDALDRYVGMDKALAANFGQGLAQIAQSYGKNPVEAVAQFMRASGVLPQQLGQYLQGQPVQQQQAQPQQPRIDPVAQQALQKVAQLEQMIAKQQEQSVVSKLENDIITPFAADNPRFEELQGDIAFFLNSGKIPTSLSPVDRLAAAYDMAERINPAPIMAQGNLAEPAETLPRAGGKSIRGAPGKSTTSSGKPKVMSIRDAIAAADRAHRSH